MRNLYDDVLEECSSEKHLVLRVPRNDLHGGCFSGDAL